MKNKKESIKELIKKLKEDWKDPRKKAGIKLLSYLIFFVILLLMAAITSRINPKNNYNKNRITSTTTTTQPIDKYNDKQISLLTDKYNINYVININSVEYKINGTINNSDIEGYIEYNNDIKKIVFKDNELKEIKNNEEIKLDIPINNDLINISHIIKLIRQNSPLKEETEVGKKYTYNIDEYNLIINIETNDEIIKRIHITNDINTYELIFDN